MKIKLQNIPESLDECSLTQVKKILEIIDLELEKEDRQIQIFLTLLEGTSSVFQRVKIFISSFFYKHIYDVSEMKYEVADIVQLIDENILLYTQKISMFPFEKSAGDFLQNMTFNQFRTVDAEYYKIIEELKATGQLNISDEFISALYDVKFFKARIKKYKLVIFHYYSSNREQLTLEFPEVFNPKKAIKTKEQLTYVEVWENILNAVAEKPQFYETVDNLNVRYVLKYINEAIKSADALQNNTTK
ncbi:hypothetical protein LV89_01986 [Arcicella aurantiaca]|uniref:Uncharacterized protein n=1 Tax=Arcicella aurantiaca TaxID=591202 RepID=A0A316EB49_9BACT|nr:hypothetical protein [Arcicella aurantiaca]PWK27171.1 hypothetical protein LV89_01986 [Arcicella aurantiaca]